MSSNSRLVGKSARAPTSQPEFPARTARARCYAEIVASVKEGFARYLLEYPERLGDERNNDAQAWSLRGLTRVIKILDRYAITDLDNPAQEPGDDAP